MKLPLIAHHKHKDPLDECVGNLQIMQSKLARNSLTEFVIGFEINEFRSKRDVQGLINIIEKQYFHRLAMDKISFLESIRIGWKLPRFALVPVLQVIVPLLLRSPARVKRLQMMINATIPLNIMERLICRTTLETLDLQSLRIQTRSNSVPRPSPRGWRNAESPIRSNSPVSSTTTTAVPSKKKDQVIQSDDIVLAALPYMPPTATTLKLNDCNLQVEHIPRLIELLRTKIHVRVLSLRHNRRLYMNGWENNLVGKLPFLKALDLSICDLNSVDGMQLAAALTQNTKSQIECLNVAGNYELRESIPDIVKACCRAGIVELDCSFCDVASKFHSQVFELLATEKQCSIRSLKMQSVRIRNVAPLIRCIEQNTSLERLVLNDPRAPCPLIPDTMDKLLVALRNNYYLQVLQVDTVWNQDLKVLKEMEHWMTLNRCGRSILLHDKNRYWPQVLVRAASLEDLDSFYWILRNGAEHFATV